jgi:hypothetical protein
MMTPPVVVVSLDMMAARHHDTNAARMPAVIAVLDDFLHDDRGGWGRGRRTVAGGECQAAQGGANDEREGGDESGHEVTSSLQ